MTDGDMRRLRHIRKMLEGAALDAARIKRPDTAIDILRDLTALTKAVRELENREGRK